MASIIEQKRIHVKAKRKLGLQKAETKDDDNASLIRSKVAKLMMKMMHGPFAKKFMEMIDE